MSAVPPNQSIHPNVNGQSGISQFGAPPPGMSVPDMIGAPAARDAGAGTGAGVPGAGAAGISGARPPPKMRKPKADPLVRPKRRPPPGARPPSQQGQAPTPHMQQVRQMQMAQQGVIPGPERQAAFRPAMGQPGMMEMGIPGRPPQPGMPLPGGMINGNSGGDMNGAVRVPPNAKPPPGQFGPDDLTVNGFSGPLLSETYQDYPLVTTKRAWREGMRFHIARFASKKKVDPRDETQFTRPVRLQRRDPRTVEQQPEEEEDETMAGLSEADKAELEVRKAAKEKEKEASQAQIAPGTNTSGKRSNALKPRTQQVFKAEMTPQEMARARVKYEEALPWNLEDFDNKTTWIGNYEAALSDTYAMFVVQNDGKVRMVPIDKWYKFTAKSQFRTLTLEEAEKYMKHQKEKPDPTFIKKEDEERVRQNELQRYAKQGKMFTGRVNSAHERFEGDDMDFEEDRFADDEENVGLFEEDEDAVLAEKRIKKDQLKANIFDLKDEKVYEDEEREEMREKEARKNYGKGVRKALQRREKNFDYSSGSDANPYSDESSDSESERLQEEERKTEEERRRKEKEAALAAAAKKSGGTGSGSGSTTPSGRPSKHSQASSSTAAPSSLARKRQGSPNASDASGTGTDTGAGSTAARKKARTAAGAGGPAGADGRQSSQPPRPRQPSVASGLGFGSQQGQAPSSRPSSLPDSRAASPATAAAAASSRASPPAPALPFPTADEVHASIPATGIASADLLRIFRPRIGDAKANQARFIGIVKDVTVYGRDKLLRPRPRGGG